MKKKIIWKFLRKEEGREDDFFFFFKFYLTLPLGKIIEVLSNLKRHHEYQHSFITELNFLFLYSRRRLD